MSSTSFHTSSSVKNMKSAAFVCKFGATHSLQQWVLAHDASWSISTSNSDERYSIPKSDEFLFLVKFDVWFCDSLYLPDLKSTYWQNRRFHQCAHCDVIRFPDSWSYCQRVLIFSKTYSDQKPSNLCQEILWSLCHRNSWICTNFQLN